MALSEKDIAELAHRYDRGSGDSVAALAEAYAISEQTVRYHLKRRGVYGADGPKPETDAELGIGEEDAPQVDLAALMDNPALQKLIDAAVAARLVQMGAAQGPTADFKALADSLAHMVEVSQMQQPGYIKPLPAHEVDKRAAAYVEMCALLKGYEAEGTAPLYTLGEDFFECRNAYTFKAGSQIRTYLPPAESFVPENETAKAVHAAMMAWIGGKTPDIGDQVEAAERESRVPLVGTQMVQPKRSSAVEVVSEPTVEPRGRKKQLPPGVSEIQHHSMAAGPAFV